MQDGRTLALVRPFAGTGEGGDLVLIDTQNFVDNTAPRRGERRHARPGAGRARCRPTFARSKVRRPAAVTARPRRCSTAAIVCW